MSVGKGERKLGKKQEKMAIKGFVPISLARASHVAKPVGKGDEKMQRNPSLLPILRAQS